MSEWKPGDVAIVHWKNDAPVRAIWVEECRTKGHYSEGHWHTAHSTFGLAPDAARPLVVIDPEDAEQVERLADLIANQGTHRGRMPILHEHKALVCALREFARPTPPECGRQLTVDLDTGRQGSHDRYVCRKPEGHDGRHQDIQAATTWDES